MPAVKAFNVYTKREETINLNILKWLELKLFGIAEIGRRRYPGWRGTLPFYIYKCSKCGRLHIDYRHGYRGFLLCDQGGG